jgi:tetratricopeptide (TPR) repeat protein
MTQDRQGSRKDLRWALIALCFLLVSTVFVFAQQMPVDAQKTAPALAQNAEVIETDVSPDSLIEADPAADPAAPQGTTGQKFSNEENQFIRINQSLKNIISENQKLSLQRDNLQKDIEALRGERMVQETRLRALASERANILKKSEEIDSIKINYEKEIEGLKKELEDVKKKVPESILIADEMNSTQGSNDASVAQGSLGSQNAATLDPKAVNALCVPEETSKEMGKLVEENQILRKDTVKLHYNLANLFFEQGKYEMSAVEYNRVLDLMPQDAATHYNLAFVSAEYLKDYKSAVDHYKRYLTLDPNASDATFVKNQILELQLKIQNKINSIADMDKGESDLPLKH